MVLEDEGGELPGEPRAHGLRPDGSLPGPGHQAQQHVPRSTELILWDGATRGSDGHV